MAKSKNGFILYDGKVNPTEFVSEKVKRGIDRYTGSKIWKRSASGDLTLNLNMVRQLHGNCLLKKLYKTRDDIDPSGSINAHRKKVNKKINKNEKSNCLF